MDWVKWEHQLGEAGADIVETPHITSILSDDWGFYYTATTNPGKVKAMLPRLSGLGEEAMNSIEEKIEALRAAIDGAPKSLRWRLMEKVGSRVRWYKVVEEVVRG